MLIYPRPHFPSRDGWWLAHWTIIFLAFSMHFLNIFQCDFATNFYIDWFPHPGMRFGRKATTLGHMHILDANLNGRYLAGIRTSWTLRIFRSSRLSRYNFWISGQNISLDESETPCLGAGQLDMYRNNSANAASAEKSFLPWGIDSWMAITEAWSKFALDALMHLPFLPPLCSSAPLVLQLSPLPPVGPLLFHPTCVIRRFSLASPRLSSLGPSSTASACITMASF